jgi:hypothetical protein
MGGAGLDCSHHHFAAVCSRPDLNRGTSFRPQARAVAPNFILHPHRGIQSSLRMIFAGHWRAEKSENAVPRRLHHITVIAPHGVDHEHERRIDDRASFFRIQVLPELGRSHDVHEKGRNHFAFALWNGLRCDGGAESECEVGRL